MHRPQHVLGTAIWAFLSSISMNSLALEAPALRGGLNSTPAEAEFVGESQEAPDWVVWRSFYGSLRHYAKEQPAVVERLLMSRLGARSNEANLVYLLGLKYLKTVETAEQAARQDLAKRFGGGMSTLRSPRELIRNQITRRLPTASERADLEKLAALPSARLLLESDGTIARFEAARQKDLDNNKSELLSVLGDRAYQRVVDLVNREVRKNVRVSQRGTRLVQTNAERSSKLEEGR